MLAHEGASHSGSDGVSCEGCRNAEGRAEVQIGMQRQMVVQKCKWGAEVQIGMKGQMGVQK